MPDFLGLGIILSSKIYYHQGSEELTQKELININKYEYLLFQNEDFDQCINNLPENIKRIGFNITSKFNQPINLLPSKLEKLSLGKLFNQPVDNLPESLIELNLNEDFNQYLDNLPNNLKYLEIGDSFNHPINNLPRSILNLKIGKSFNYPIDNLPPLLWILKFHYQSNFNHPLNNLPSNLKHIELGSGFNQEIDNLPDSVEKIIICNDNYEKLIKKLPKYLKEICMPLNYPWYQELANLANPINAKIFYI